MSFSVKNNKLLHDGRVVEFVKSPYAGSALPQPARILVMHFTYGASARSSAEWFRSPGNRGSSAHLPI